MSEFASEGVGIALDYILRGMGVATSAENRVAASGQVRAGDGEAAEAGADVVQRTFDQDLAAIHDAYVIGYLFDFGELMAGEKDGAAVYRAVFNEQTKQRVQGDRVEPGGGLVEDEQPRALGDGCGECHLGLVAQR